MSKVRKITILRDTVLDGKSVRKGDVVETSDTYLVNTGAAAEGEVKLKSEGKKDATGKGK